MTERGVTAETFFRNAECFNDALSRLAVGRVVIDKVRGFRYTTDREPCYTWWSKDGVVPTDEHWDTYVSRIRLALNTNER